MPCSDGGPSPEQMRHERNAPRALCAILTVLEAQPALLDQVLNAIDWREAGITKSWLLAWWENHKLEDAQRRIDERRSQESQKVREEALAKLSPEERRTLGVFF